MNSFSQDTLFKALGQRIRAIRLSKGLRQKAVIEKGEFHKGSYSDIEAGRRNVSLLTLYKIAFALEEPITSFFDDNEFYDFLKKFNEI